MLRRGRNVMTTRSAVATEASLATAMLGDRAAAIDLEHAIPPGVVTGGEVIARLTNVSSASRGGAASLVAATLTVRAGEIVGVAAVEGNGERELLRILAGRERPGRGEVVLPARIGYVPQDRHAYAIADDLSITENVALADAGSRRGWIDWRKLSARTADLIGRYDVRAEGPGASAASLSGGNQQRLVLGRELDDRPRLVVADQPTRGLDLRATAEVHARLRAARAAGSGVVVHSADLDEVVALADRVIVVAGGRVKEVRGDRDAIGRAMLGADTSTS